MEDPMKRFFFPAALALAVVAVITTSALVFAQNQPPQRRPGAMWQQGPGGRGPAGMWQHLNLTDDQRTKIQSLMQQQRQAHQADTQKMMDLQQQLKNAIFADGGPGDVGSLPDQIASLQAQLEKDRISVEKQIAAILTADQRKQVREAPGPGFGPMMGARGRGRGGMHHGPAW